MALKGPNLLQSKLIWEEIDETGLGKLETNIKLLKEWIACQPHLPKKYDTRMLALVIRGCKHNLDRAKTKIDTYFSVRASMPEIFQKRNPLSNEVKDAAKHFTVTPLPNLTPEGYRVTVHRFTGAPVSEFDPTAIYKMIFMKADIRMVEEPLIAGDVFVFDVAHMSLTHIAKLATILTKNVLFCAQEAYPQRLKEIHMINAPPFVDKVVNLYKMFLKDKMKNRIQIHPGHKTLFSFVPQNILPSNYDGDEKPMESLEGEWEKKLEIYADWFREQDLVLADESRRLFKKSSLHNSENIFGCEGAFRKLAID